MFFTIKNLLQFVTILYYWYHIENVFVNVDHLLKIIYVFQDKFYFYTFLITLHNNT